MKAILEFNLPEDREDFETTFRGIDYKIALQEIRNAFRAKEKYEEHQETTWSNAHELFWETLREAGVELS